jgi:hypothetical protein
VVIALGAIKKALAMEKEIKMKNWMFVSIVIGLVLAMSACGSSQNATASAAAATTLSMESQLLVGTLKLESTSLAVSAEQAGQLLPLWETLQSLASSGTAASQEVESVISQIESTMNAQQISNITAMNLTSQDLTNAIADSGTAPAGLSKTTAASAAQSQSGGLVGGAPGGGNPPADVVGNMPAPTGSQAASQASTSSTQSIATMNQVPTALIQALVEMLEKKIG